MEDDSGKLSLRQHYVYELRNPDTKELFYVGKGLGERRSAHVKAAIKNSNNDEQSEKIKIINDLLEKHGEILELIIGRYDTDEEAKAVEATLIKWIYGINNLTNISHGRHSKSIRSKDGYNVEPYIDEPKIKREVTLDYTRNIIKRMEESGVPGVFEEIKCKLEEEFGYDLNFHSSNENDKTNYSIYIPYNDKLQLQIGLTARGQKVNIRRVKGGIKKNDFESVLKSSEKLGVTKADFAALKDLTGRNRRTEEFNFEHLIQWLNDSAEALKDIDQNSNKNTFPLQHKSLHSVDLSERP